MVTRTKTESSLGLAAANINQWGAGVPFGDRISTGATRIPYVEIPDSLVDNNGNGIADAATDAPRLHAQRPIRCRTAMRRRGGNALG